MTRGEQFDSRAASPLADLERIRAQRNAARLVCAANATGRTKAQRRKDLAQLLDMLGLYPQDDPQSLGSIPTCPGGDFHF